MFYSFARVTAVTGMNVEDYYQNGYRVEERRDRADRQQRRRAR